MSEWHCSMISLVTVSSASVKPVSFTASAASRIWCRLCVSPALRVTFSRKAAETGTVVSAKPDRRGSRVLHGSCGAEGVEDGDRDVVGSGGEVSSVSGSTTELCIDSLLSSLSLLVLGVLLFVRMSRYRRNSVFLTGKGGRSVIGWRRILSPSASVMFTPGSLRRRVWFLGL